MGLQHVLDLQQSAIGAALPGCWQLGAGRVVTLRAQEHGALRVTQGEIWATVDEPHSGRGNESGDLFLAAGDTLALRPGLRVVLEAWDEGGSRGAWFSWEGRSINSEAGSGAVAGWCADVVQPVRELGRSLAAAGRAVAHLAIGLGALAIGRVSGHGRGRILQG
ncbi:MAG: hypothetical protein OJF60_003493 [Burkholderiaceae bacterium]|jgi:hypothetical protein|nr:MAG: hypothetical protein OJF60_003493 [Burkholderiaceae bacterium]